MGYPHRPVLVHEVLKHLITSTDGIYVDGTVGSGGHSEAINKEIGERGRLICLDRDAEAIGLSRDRLSSAGVRVVLLKARFSDLDSIIRRLGIATVQGILLDLGMSSYQLDQSGRGFSFNRDESLDMRMDQEEAITAHQLINNLTPNELEKIFRHYGEEKRAKAIAKSIVRERRKKPVETSLQLANLIKTVVPPSHRPGAKHPATRTFQALRIAVNRELENLKEFLDKAPTLFHKGGRLVILSYHSLEDRLVKQKMMNWEKKCLCPPDLPTCVCDKTPLFRRLQKKGIKPGREEIEENPRARSAILRAAERI